MKQRVLSASLIALIATAPATLSAQQLSSKIADLIRFGTCAQALCISTGPGIHQTHYLNSANLASNELVEFLTNSITASVGRLPVSATSGGTTFSFVNGAPVQTSTSAGPIFAERATTLGSKRFLAGVNTTRISYSQLRGQPIKDLDINLSHEDVGATGLGDSPFESDIIGINIDMKLNLQVTSLFATYGINDRIDVSVAVPFVMANLDATAAGRVYGVNGVVSGAHVFGTAGSPSLTATSAAKGNSSGIGDITARMKINLQHTANSGFALLANVHLPTGDDKQFLGSGAASANALLIASMTRGNFSPHANVGFALRTGDSENNALLGTFGFDQMINKKFTVAVDLLSEFQAGGDSGTLPQDINLTLLTPAKSIQGTNIPSQKDNPINLSAGARFLVGGFTVLGNGVVPVKKGGMQASFIWTLGLERSF